MILVNYQFSLLRVDIKIIFIIIIIFKSLGKVVIKVYDIWHKSIFSPSVATFLMFFFKVGKVNVRRSSSIVNFMYNSCIN